MGLSSEAYLWPDFKRARCFQEEIHKAGRLEIESKDREHSSLEGVSERICTEKEQSWKPLQRRLKSLLAK